MRRTSGIAIAGAICLTLATSSPATAGEPADSCPAGEIRTASGCTSFEAAGREVQGIVNQAFDDNDLRAALAARRPRRSHARQELARGIDGGSAGEPADALPHRLDGDPLSSSISCSSSRTGGGCRSTTRCPTGFPICPTPIAVTLRMLANVTSGYPDWIQGNPDVRRQPLLRRLPAVDAETS